MTINLHPEFLKKDGKPQFVVLSYDEFVFIQNALEDFEDLQSLRKAKIKRKNEPLISMEEMKKELGL